MKSLFFSSILGSLLALAGCNKSEPAPTLVETRTEVDPGLSTNVASTADSQGASSTLPQLGMAPEWQLKRIDGSMMSSTELAGKVVVLDFWATWCPPCRDEIPGYIEMQRELESKGVVIVGVSLDQGGPGVVEKFAAQFKINYPLVMADENTADLFGGIEAIPTTFLIDRDGQVRHRKVGSMERHDYEPLVRSLL